MNELIKHLETTNQLSGIMEALEKDDLVSWLSPLHRYAKETDQATIGLIDQLIDYYYKETMKQL